MCIRDRDTMRELIQKMEHQLCDNPVIEEQMRQLVQALETLSLIHISCCGSHRSRLPE